VALKQLAPLAALPVLVLASSALFAQQDPLPSWNDTAPKRAIVAFVGRVTEPGSPEFVPPPERIATFDNDGTLWAEQPVYVQVLFIIDRIEALAPRHPEWRTQQPFAAILEGGFTDLVANIDERQLLALFTATHAGMTTDEFSATVSDWIATARHPTTGKLFTEMVYQPMLELLAYLRANGFKTFIVSGGGVEFMRPWTESVYGIPPEQVIGSSGALKFELREGEPVLLKVPEVDFVDDKEGKPVAIQRHIGRRPIMAFGNSDGDLQMLQWTMGGAGPRFALLVHHTDAEREWAYDRDSAVGRLDTAWDEATANDWTLVSIEDDWISVFPN
jgi:phosphoglycolate phosphatase-like HAD superfamily hydrolase